ncbi:oxidoreductase, aldo/keto reductase, putative [Acanthamoeba castellanii str. Neff]|uniref:Oxidoreductase, aldo/keto reductase, putative n=1 Tax=Acanthamoeba castellanii (strain ATCC 30010 / Neff) TaxID=1257118 RepID=L8H3T6_ACACF|nr:oxidoreductase, aldo/keto reductase, putative [Acanthamoeba castellanii str. Neff]ELR19870.1 oxidoreductase, aldo/keto reductase, putative [Acanthamoeba castellanii str. Neff]
MTTLSPTLDLNTGAKIPVVGLGTWQAGKGEVGAAVKAAIKAGYRHFDCAEIYGNEAEIGEAFKSAFDEGLVKREELFITSKVFNNHHQPERAVKAIHNTLKNLQIPYLDLSLIHWPIKFEEEQIAQPLRTPEGKLNPAITWSFDFKETWKTLEELQKQGLAKSIGVSNFTVKQLEELLADAQVVPAVNQVEFHPYLFQAELLNYCTSKGIVLTAYSPLGSTVSSEGVVPLLENEVVKDIAAEVGRSAAQVVLRWGVQKHITVIPKSSNEERLRANFAIFDFELSPEQVARLDSLPQHRFIRLVPGHFE